VNIYVEMGYKNRTDYLMSLVEDYAVSYQTVRALADVLGPNEDFDGLVTALEDLDGGRIGDGSIQTCCASV